MRKNIIAIPLLAVLLLSAVQTGGTLAYLHTTTNAVVNQFAPAQAEIEIRETFEEGDLIKQDVEIANTENVAVYLRVKLVAQAQDENGVMIANPVQDGESTRAITQADFNISPMRRWIKVGEYYYYKNLLPAGESVPLFATASLKDEIVFEERYTPILTVVAQGVQANALLLDDVWPEVTVGENGALKKVGESHA